MGVVITFSGRSNVDPCWLRRLADRLSRARERVRDRRSLACLCASDGRLLADLGLDRGWLQYQAGHPAMACARRRQ